MANAGYATASYEIIITTSMLLEIVGFDVDKDKWTSKFAKTSKHEAAANAILASEEPGLPQLKTRLEKLGDAVFKVSRSLKPGEKPSIKCLVQSLQSVKEKGVVPTGTDALFIDRFRRSAELLGIQGEMVGIEHGAAGIHVGFHPGHYVTELVNTAALDGETLSSDMFAIAVKTDGSTWTPSASSM